MKVVKMLGVFKGNLSNFIKSKSLPPHERDYFRIEVWITENRNLLSQSFAIHEQFREYGNADPVVSLGLRLLDSVQSQQLFESILNGKLVKMKDEKPIRDLTGVRFSEGFLSNFESPESDELR